MDSASANGGWQVVVPEEGVEPSRPCGHGILSPARLPFRHSGTHAPRLKHRQSLWSPIAERHESIKWACRYSDPGLPAAWCVSGGAGGKPRFNYVTGQAPALRPRSKDVAVAAQTGWPAVVVNRRVSWIPAFAGMTSRQACDGLPQAGTDNLRPYTNVANEEWEKVRITGALVD